MVILDEETVKRIRADSITGQAFEDIPIEVSAVLGVADMNIANLLKIGRGAVIELDRRIGEPVELRCQGQTIGLGEVVVIDGKLAIEVRKILGGKDQDPGGMEGLIKDQENEMEQS